MLVFCLLPHVKVKMRGQRCANKFFQVVLEGSEALIISLVPLVCLWGRVGPLEGPWELAKVPRRS